VDILEVFIINEELDSPHAALLMLQVPKPVIPALGPQIQQYILPQDQAGGKVLSPAGSPPDMPGQVPHPTSHVVTPHSPSPPPTWRTEWSTKVEDDSNDNNEVVTCLLTEDLVDISLQVEPSHTPTPSTTFPTPSTDAPALPSTYVSPDEKSEYSDFPLVTLDESYAMERVSYIGSKNKLNPVQA